MTRTTTISIDDPGCGFINLNQRTHWRAKAKLTKQWREAAELLAHMYDVPRYERAHVVATFYKTTFRKYDVGNLAPTVKAVVDGLVSAGVFPDDDNAHVVGPDLRAGTTVKNGDAACLVITIEELPDAGV